MAYDVFLPFYFSLLIVISPQFSLSELSLLLGKLIVVSLVGLQPVMLYFDTLLTLRFRKYLSWETMIMLPLYEDKYCSSHLSMAYVEMIRRLVQH